MEKRASIPVSLPQENPTISYWQDPPDEIADLRSTAQLPDAADVVIIGSGISGAAIAHNILCRAPKTKAVMLEARQACSGATGRNGGHTKAASYTTFATNVDKVGLDEAIKIARLEYNTIRQVHAFAKEHNIPCDSRPMDTVDIIYDKDTWDFSVKTIKRMRECMPGDPASRYTLWNSEETEATFLCKGATGAVTYEAGSVSAYKFVIGLLKICLGKGLNLQANTPATGLSRQSQGGWIVTTPRGQIRVSKVIMATNGYSAALYPKLQGVIVPLRGQITAHRPGSNMPKNGLATTYSFLNRTGFEYMIPRPPGTKFAGDIVIGGGLVKAKEEGLYQYGTVDDTTLDPDISKYLANTTSEFFGKNWGKDDVAGRIRREWSGIMGYSGDGHPLVGEMPGEPGFYISASFQGHGMVFCFLCAQALTSMLFGDDEKLLFAWFPKTFKVTAPRLQIKLKERTSHTPLKDDVKSRL